MPRDNQKYKQEKPFTVTHFLRKPREGDFSVERLYEDVRSNIPNNIVIKKRINKYLSNGIIKRAFDAFFSVWFQKDINHITGDIHYLSFFLNRRRNILTILDCVGLERSSGIKFWLLWFFWYWLPVKRCRLIIVISESTKQQLLKYIKCDPNKIKVIYCNVSDDFVKTPKSFNSERPRILHIGTGDNKNLNRHILAIKGLPCDLIIIGRLSKKDLILLKDNNISYENYTNLSSKQIINQYVCCDLLLFASTYEGFGIPIIEAQKVGRPVVTSNLLSMPEVSGDGAILVDPFNEESIRSGVRMIIENKNIRDSLIINGLENCKKYSSREISLKYAKTYLEFFQSI